jgi:thioredoxin-like negative regulator of GroEL
MSDSAAGPIESTTTSVLARPTTGLANSQRNQTGKFLRPIDWAALLLTFGCVWAGYSLTLAPEVTLEDSGELATGSFYAGIPHPPGYPVWTIYTWLWTVLVPFKNVAWRVALGEATSGALAAGLLSMLVSRGSSSMIRGVAQFQTLARSSENLICLVAGFVAGMLLGFNGFMWSQSVIVEVYSFSVASFILVLLCLLRWIHSPTRWRYLFFALFFHGICFTNHQTLVVAAMGIEVVIAAANYRMGRYLFLGNSILYVAGLLLKQQHLLTAWDENQAIFVIFNIVGICSIACYGAFCFLSKETTAEYGLDAALAGLFLSLTAIPAVGLWMALVACCALLVVAVLAFRTRALGLEWLVVMGCGCCWILGASFYFYLPLAGMTNPPMEWGYPRTVAGFIQAFTRGQYEKTNPTDLLHDPLRFLTQLSMLGEGIIEEFNWVYALLALLPFLFFFRIHQRERRWLAGMAAIYFCLGIVLLILLNPPPDRAAQQLVRVFFTASHTVIAMLVGYAVALSCAWLVTHYHSFRFWGLAGGAVALGLAVFSYAGVTSRAFFGETASVGPGQLLEITFKGLFGKDQFGVPIYAGLILIGLALAFLIAIWRCRERPPLSIVLLIFSLMPAHSILTHWADNEQHNHWFGYYFGHDMFAPPFKADDQRPFYPELSKNAILFGGTDPGRFCPTYMIFCDSFLPARCQPEADRHFDRRDVYIITQNALADGTYLEYIRAQYSRSAQIDPPFFQELFRSAQERNLNLTTNVLARAVAPLDRTFEQLGDRIEKERRTFTSWFKASDFLDLPGLSARLRPGPKQDEISKFVYERLSTETRNLLDGPGADRQLRVRLADDFNQVLDPESKEPIHGAASAEVPSSGLYTAERFNHVELSEYLKDFIAQNPTGHTRIRLNRLLLEAAYPVELAKSPGGVYPDREIHTPSNEDLERCYSEYARDAQRRSQLNQLKPGEDLKRQGDRVQISGPAAVMGINALLTKVIFDQNPKNDFFVEESFPLDWMYPHLTPFGIIMKINREPVPALTEQMVNTDHQFWCQYSERLVGNWITYQTSIAEIARWAEQIYLNHNFRGFAGDRRFIRDDQAQKAFSKVRGAIAGLYLWRVNASSPGSPDRARMLKEADFAFRQAFAMCPYNPEILVRYINLLVSPEMQRVDDALLLARTSQKLDPYNASIADLIKQLTNWKAQRSLLNPARLEQQLQAQPGDVQVALDLAAQYFQLGQTNAAVRALDQVLRATNAPTAILRSLIPVYATLSNAARLQDVTELLAARFQAQPGDSSAGIGAAQGYRVLGQQQLALQNLDRVLASPALDPNAIMQTAEELIGLGDYNRLEQALLKLTQVAPESPEAWFDLAALRSILGRTNAALANVHQALALSAARRQRDPSARDLSAEVRRDPRFNALRAMPEFKKMTGVK